jgi:hypothetical protein
MSKLSFQLQDCVMLAHHTALFNVLCCPTRFSNYTQCTTP